MPRFLLALALPVALHSNVALSFHFPDVNRPIDYPESLLALPEVSYDFEGIIALSNCSGSLVRFDDSRDDEAAMVLSNGHCVQSGLIAPGTVMSDIPSSRTFTVLGRDAKRLGTLRGDRLLYATMTKTDFALYRVKETFAEIEEKFNVRPFTLSREQPALGSPIQVVSGYWKRGYSCEVEYQTPTLQEGDWFFQDSLRYSRPGCEVIGGTSGSPVIASGTRTVVAVNNSVNEGGTGCRVNNPCEIDANGKTLAKKGYGYAQQTYWIYSCRAADGSIDLTIDGCLLPHLPARLAPLNDAL